MAISEGYRKSHPYPVKEDQWYINLNPGCIFVQQPPKRERDQEAHLNYYASAYNRKRQLSHCKTKLNQIQQKQAYILTKNRQNQHAQKLKPGLVASCDIRPGNGVGRILVEWEGTEKQKIDEASEIEKRGKSKRY